MSNFYDNVYPKDLTMTMESNYIQGEVKKFDEAQDRIFVPNGGPFYSESLILRDNNGNLLQPDLDYKLYYLNETATVESGRDVVTVIWILNETLVSVTFEYRVVGGEFGNTVYAILQEFRKSGPIAKNVDWNTNVFNKPNQYPAAPHYHTPETFSDWEMIYKQLEGIRVAIIGGDLAAWQAHYNYLRNLLRNLQYNLDLKFDKHPDRDDVYTKPEIDEMFRKFRAECCNGNGGGTGGVDENNGFSITSKVEGEYVVYEVVSSDPNSSALAEFEITETAPVPAETFTMDGVRQGDEMIFTITSSRPESTTEAAYQIVESNE